MKKTMKKTTKPTSLRGQINKLRSATNDLTANINKLKSTNDFLERNLNPAIKERAIILEEMKPPSGEQEITWEEMQLFVDTHREYLMQWCCDEEAPADQLDSFIKEFVSPVDNATKGLFEF